MIGSKINRTYQDDKNWVVLRVPDEVVESEDVVAETDQTTADTAEVIDTNMVEVMDVSEEISINPLEEEPPSANVVESVEESASL